MDNKKWIKRNRDYTLVDGMSGFTLNFAGMDFSKEDIEGLSDKFAMAHKGMKDIESGKIKNPDENRQVMHFSDRISYPKSDLFQEVERFAESIRTGQIKSSSSKKFNSLVINGIGGSALGPQLVQFALNGPYWNELNENQRDNYLKIYFLDNTDSAGFADMLAVVDLETTLIASISKSGGTQETKNNLISCQKAFESAGLDFAKHACAITMKGSELDKFANENSWIKIFEMAESTGGRTSETSIVGHLPAALTGLDFSQFTRGAAFMDEWTRGEKITENPAYMMAAMWYIAGGGKGNKNMVIVPYSDRLILLSRYLQQLVMESLGKEHDLDGNTVHQGLNVFGNKGGTDAHAFIQQLNDGRNDFFVTFVEVWKDALTLPVDKNTTMSDYLHGFQTGLASALRGNNRQVIEMRIREVSEYNLGMIIAMYERAVAVYAELVNINAFHQPGVQAYKLASKSVIDLIISIQDRFAAVDSLKGTASEIASELDIADQEVELSGILAKFAENGDARDFSGFDISREWDDSRGWVYSVNGK